MARPGEPRINEEIRSREVRLIDADGTQLGIKSIHEAMSLALARNLDLLEIAPGANPPVAKISDYSKYRYEREKRIKESRKHQKGGLVKEIRFRVMIGQHDLATKIEHSKEFIKEKFKVRFTVVFRGREMEHRHLGVSLLGKVKEMLEGKFLMEQEPALEGNRMSMLLAPKR